MTTLLSDKEHYFGFAPDGDRLSNAEVSKRWDDYVTKVENAASLQINPGQIAGLKSGEPLFRDGHAVSGAELEDVHARAVSEALHKAMTPDLIKANGGDRVASITAAMETVKAQIPDITKDVSLSSPLSTGLVAYDLEAPAKMLTPRPTPLRNRIPRERGIGTSRKFKVISGFPGVAGPNAIAAIRPGITETTQNNFAPAGAGQSLYYARGPKISYQGYDVSVPYLQFSLSDEVTWGAQYAGQGFQDIRGLSRTSLLYASMLSEERLLLGGRGSAGNSFAGALGAPTTPTGASGAPAAGQTGLSGVTTNVYVKCTAEGMWGESTLSAAVTVATSNGNVVTVTVPAPDVPGATGYRFYVSTGASDPGDASRFYAGRSGSNVFVIQGALPTTTKAASTVTADTSSSALDYDGILTVCAAGAGGQPSGYVKRLNAVFATGGSAGSEFQAAFAAMYDPSSGGVLADPDRVLMNGTDRKQLSEAVKSGSVANYTMRVTQDEISGVSLGSVVATIVNEVTGKAVAVEVHPYMPQGNAPIISDTLPVPDSQVDACFKVVNVQDLMGVDWTPQQFAFESSSYWFGTFMCQAPQWQGIVQGIKPA
jgi:hypothetical protein